MLRQIVTFARLLIKHDKTHEDPGSLQSLVNAQGCTPLQLALEFSNLEIAKEILHSSHINCDIVISCDFFTSPEEREVSVFKPALEPKTQVEGYQKPSEELQNKVMQV